MPIVYPANADTSGKKTSGECRYRSPKNHSSVCRAGLLVQGPHRVLREMKIEPLKASEGRFLGSVLGAMWFGRLVERQVRLERLVIFLLTVCGREKMP